MYIITVSMLWLNLSTVLFVHHPLEQWLLTFFAPRTTKTQKKFPRTPKVSKIPLVDPETLQKRLKWLKYFIFVIFVDP